MINSINKIVENYFKISNITSLNSIINNDTFNKSIKKIKDDIINNLLNGKYVNDSEIKLVYGYYKPKSLYDFTNVLYSAISICGNNSDMNWINTSEITDMSNLFQNSEFNGNISNWDTSNVENMSYMFQSSKFNGDISKWNTSKVKNMSYMFDNNMVFNQNISNWNTSRVRNMSFMFNNAVLFNLDISNWDVSHVNNMSNMFNNAATFNLDISNWDVKRVSDMSEMFKNANKFSFDISSWDTSNVENMSYMFFNARNYHHDTEKINKEYLDNDNPINGGSKDEIHSRKKIYQIDLSKIKDKTTEFSKYEIMTQIVNIIENVKYYKISEDEYWQKCQNMTYDEVLEYSLEIVNEINKTQKENIDNIFSLSDVDNNIYSIINYVINAMEYFKIPLKEKDAFKADILSTNYSNGIKLAGLKIEELNILYKLIKNKNINLD